MAEFPRPAIGVSAVVLDAQNRVLLALRGQPPAQGLWHFPGGKLEPGEGLVEACRREVREETGLSVQVGPILAVVERRIEGFHYIIIDFLARLENPEDCACRAADDALRAEWVAMTDLERFPIAEGLLPILARACAVRGGARSAWTDGEGAGTDFIWMGE